MKKIIMMGILLAAVINIYSFYNFGAGVLAGKPTGLRLKYNSDPYKAVSATLAWDLNAQRVNMSAVFDYNFLIKDKSKKYFEPFFIYTGFGGRAIFETNPRLGLMFSIGGAFRPDLPFEAFFEASPILDIYPATGFDIDGGIGFIFYFF